MPERPGNPDIFLSYAREDTNFVRELYAALSETQHSVWVDWEGIPPSAAWLDEIYAAINTADTFVFVISPDSIDSQACQQEVAHALANNKRLIPVLYREMPVEQVPEALRRLNWISFTDAANLKRGLTLLTSAIETDLAWVRAHTRLLTRAVEWHGSGHDTSMLLRGKDLQEAMRWLAQSEAGKTPHATDLQREFVGTSSAWEAGELERVRGLYHGALSRQLAAQADQAKTTDLALLLAVEARRAQPTLEANTSLLKALRRSPRLLAILRDSKHHFRELAFSPDGQLLAAACSDEGRIMVFRTDDGSMTGAWAVEEGMRGVGFTPSGVLAYGSGTKVCFWDSSTGKPLEALRPGIDGRSFILSPDGLMLAVIDASRFSITLFDLKLQQRIGSALTVEKASIEALAFSSDGGLLACGSGGEVMVWDVKTRRPGHSLGRVPGVIRGLAFEPDTGHLFSAGDDGQVIRWALASGDTPQLLHHFAEGARSLALSPDGALLAASSYGSPSVAILDPSNGEQIPWLEGHPEGAGGLAFNPTGERLAEIGGRYHEMILLWDMRRGVRRGQALQDSTRVIPRVAFSSLGDTLMALQSGGTLRRWRVADGVALPSLELACEGTRSAEFSADGSLVAIGADHGAVSLFRTDVLAPPVLRFEKHRNVIRDVVFNLDGRWLASGDDERTVIVWDLQSARPLWSLYEGHRGGIRQLAFRPGCASLAVAAGYESLVVWDLSQEPPRQAVAPVTGRRASCVAYSPDGKYLAWGSDDTTGEIWDATSLIPIGKPLEGHEEALRSIAFSSDGQLLATADERAIILWNATSHHPLVVLPQQGNMLADLSFHPSIPLLATADEAGIVLWDVDIDRWATRACAIANRDLSRKEWSRYFGDGVPYRQTRE